MNLVEYYNYHVIMTLGGIKNGKGGLGFVSRAVFDVGVQQIYYVDSTCGPARNDKFPPGRLLFYGNFNLIVKVCRADSHDFRSWEERLMTDLRIGESKTSPRGSP